MSVNKRAVYTHLFNIMVIWGSDEVRIELIDWRDQNVYIMRYLKSKNFSDVNTLHVYPLIEIWLIFCCIYINTHGLTHTY